MVYFFGLIIAALIIAVILVVYHDMNHFIITGYDIHSDKLKKDVTFCLLSDLHEKSFGEKNSKLIRAIDEIAPDAILLAGDILSARQELGAERYDEIAEFVVELCHKYPVYASNGNHEHKMDILGGERQKAYKNYEKKITEAGCVLLRNTGTYLEDLNMEIHGLELDQIFFKKIIKNKMPEGYIDQFFGKPCKDRYQLLIAHNPIYFQNYKDWGADLTVSGHVHGGIIRLPYIGGVISPALTLFPKYDGGLYEIEDSKMILSKGLSTHSIRVRFNNPGELCVIRLFADKK